MILHVTEAEYLHDYVIRLRFNDGAEGEVDLARVKPLLFDMSSRKYWSLGQAMGNCWSVGKQYKK